MPGLRFDQRCEDLESGDETVTGRRMIGEDDVAGLLAADVAAALAHLLEHVAVTDLGAQQLEPGPPASVRVRGWTSPSRRCRRPKLAAAMEAERDQGHQLVAVDDPAFLVDHDQSVGIAVEREADVSAAGDDRFLQQLGWVDPQCR